MSFMIHYMYNVLYETYITCIMSLMRHTYACNISPYNLLVILEQGNIHVYIKRCLVYETYMYIHVDVHVFPPLASTFSPSEHLGRGGVELHVL